STDAKVLSQFPSSRKSYADAMLKTQMASIGLPAACHWQASHPLKERILMLKNTTPAKLVRVFGFGVVTTLCLTGAFAAWSSQPANIILASAKTAMLYEIKIDALIDRVHQEPITLREVPGKTFAVVQGEGEQAWSYEFALTPIDDQFSIIKGKVKYGQKVISEPEFKIANGKNAVISVNTKDHASSISLNLIASLIRNGKPVPVPAYNGDNGVANGSYMMQNSDGTQEIYTRADLEAAPNIASEDKIKMPAKMVPTAEFLAVQEAGKNSGQSAIKGVIYVDASGGMVGAKFDASLAGAAVKKLADLIAKQKYEAAIGLDGNTVASKLDIEIYFDASKP
ncbi:MAG: M56 family metallopeptidase, partial [Arenimonas sp.]